VVAHLVTLYVCCAVYANLRYVVFNPKNLEHIPVFVMNKGMSMGAALCFSLAFWVQWRLARGAQPAVAPALWFRGGLFGVFMHVPMSLAILQPAYFKEFFHESGRLSFQGEAVFFFGALALGGLYLLTRTDWSPRHRWQLSLAAMLTLFTHTLFMGISRGINFNASHGYLPPMWMLSLFGIAAGVAYLLMSRPKVAAA